MISFDNTEQAFAYKSDADLKKAAFLFSCMSKKWIVDLGTRLAPLAIKWSIPFAELVIRKTIFQQFVGGESLEQTTEIANKLEKFGVQVILDYGVEGKEGEDNFNYACQQFIKVIDYASTQQSIPFMSIKITGMARFSLLETIHTAMSKANGSLMDKYTIALQNLGKNEKQEWQQVVERLKKIVEEGSQKNIGVLIDAEETWIQDPIDAMVMLLMSEFNRNKAVIFNTIQLYRHDRLQFLKDSLQNANNENFVYGIKLVRGAYMEKERKRAELMNYLSPIQINKENSDRDFNEAVLICINNLNNVSVVIASHNEYSNLLATQLLKEKNLPLNHPNVHFSQLYGMSDNITFNLAKGGCRVSKYLPFGPIKDVIPYLMRRAQENSSVSGQTGRELSLILKEKQRRRI